MTTQCCVCLLNDVRRDAETYVGGYSVCEQHIEQANGTAIAALTKACERRHMARSREAQLFTRKAKNRI